MNDPYHLQRFVTAQDPVYDRVLRELGEGRKQSHWMWFVFPQIAGLGWTPAARRYAIASVDEARAFLQHPLLGERLRECTRAVLAVENRSAEQIFAFPDVLKFRSCMTLFEAADPAEPLFSLALDRFYSGERDELTLNRLASADPGAGPR